MGVHRHFGVFDSIISSQGLIDIHMTGGKFTWSNNHEIPTLERLDRFLMSEELGDLFPRVLVYKLPRDISDHNPLILTNSSGQPLKNISFQFELSWLKQPDFLPTIQSIWEKPCYAVSAMDRIQAKLKRFK